MQILKVTMLIASLCLCVPSSGAQQAEVRQPTAAEVQARNFIAACAGMSKVANWAKPSAETRGMEQFWVKLAMDNNISDYPFKPEDFHVLYERRGQPVKDSIFTNLASNQSFTLCKDAFHKSGVGSAKNG